VTDATPLSNFSPRMGYGNQRQFDQDTNTVGLTLYQPILPRPLHHYSPFPITDNRHSSSTMSLPSIPPSTPSSNPPPRPPVPSSMTSFPSVSHWLSNADGKQSYTLNARRSLRDEYGNFAGRIDFRAESASSNCSNGDTHRDLSFSAVSGDTGTPLPPTFIAHCPVAKADSVVSKLKNWVDDALEQGSKNPRSLSYANPTYAMWKTVLMAYMQDAKETREPDVTKNAELVRKAMEKSPWRVDEWEAVDKELQALFAGDGAVVRVKEWMDVEESTRASRAEAAFLLERLLKARGIAPPPQP
jgi:hypothetical protein